MDYLRLLRHVVLPHWWVRRPFSADLLRRVEIAVEASETVHRGELRVVLEANLPLPRLLHEQTTRARALELFSQLRVWDTAENSGVLIYLQLIDRHVEIVGDRGINAKVDQSFWDAVCRRMEEAFKAEDFEGGMLFALNSITEALRQHFPAAAVNPNELPNRPVIL